MMYHHPKKGPDGDLRFNFPHSSVFLSLFDVRSYKIVYPCYKFLKEPVSKFVFLQGRKEQEPHESNVGMMFVHCAQCQIIKHSKVVTLIHCLLKRFVSGPRKLHFSLASLVIEDRSVELILSRKMLKNHRFRHAGRTSDLFCCCSAKTVLREKLHGCLYD